jgi:hypothetical protein
MLTTWATSKMWVIFFQSVDKAFQQKWMFPPRRQRTTMLCFEDLEQKVNLAFVVLSALVQSPVKLEQHQQMVLGS